MFFRKYLFSVTTVALLLAVSLTFVQAQSTDTPRIEIGAQFSLLRIQEQNTNNPGVGGRIGWNIHNHVGLEAEVNVFPERDKNRFASGRMVQGQFGLKAGWRSDRFGVFAKVRPGFINFDRLVINNCPPGAVCTAALIFGKQTKFSLDAGGVLEYYPSRHSVLRFDLGNTIIRFNERNFPRSTTSNLQFSTGVGFRF